MKRVAPTAEEIERANSGARPRLCYCTSLFGCVAYHQAQRYCRECPWGEWLPGQPLPAGGGPGAVGGGR